jgi:asparaginyl-tRNA synthetase
MASEHERYLCEQVYHKPVIVYNYPCAIKSFYMRRNPAGTDGAPEPTCAAMDVLVPGVGELIGGSVRLSPKPTKQSWAI